MTKLFLNSMTVRIFLIVVGGTLISALLVLLLATSERKDLESHMRFRRTAERVEQIILMLDAAPASSRPTIANLAESYGIKIDFAKATTVIGKSPDSEFTAALKETLGEDKQVVAIDRKSKDCPVRISNDAAPNLTPHCEAVFTTLKDGTPLSLIVGHRNHQPLPMLGNFHRNLVVFLAVLILIALFVTHMATKPLRRLVKAAQDLGRNIEHQPLPENEGPTEVQEAAIAFNSMQTSIRNHIQERTYMLSAIAHDLQTPLTRLRLRLEKVADEELRARLVADLTATQNMVREGLDFAQSINADEPFELVDLDSLVEAICNDATDAGCEVTYEGRIGKPILACPHTLRRCISNLLDNAIKYGKFAHVNLKHQNSKAIISIIDGGPGIPADKLEEVFQPFNRIETSRSRNLAGTGLGLTIARIIAGRHRGEIKLRNMGTSELGLVATLELPLL